MKSVNPISGAIRNGLAGAAAVALGAVIRGNNVHDEAITQMVGGAVTGAIAGTMGCVINYDNENIAFKAKLALMLLAMGLDVAAALTAPLMGKTIIDLNTEWSDVVVDDLIGSSIFAGSILTLAGAALACANYQTLRECCTPRFFSSPKASRVEPQETATAAPTLPV